MPRKVKTRQTDSPRPAQAPVIPGPDPIEKSEAVRRILASATFAKLPVLAPLLQRLVNDSLQGKVGGKGYEITLAVDVFQKDPSWTPLQNDVRQGMVNLRKQLRAYYSVEGGNDGIEISFPLRSGFAPRFSYRRLTDPTQSVQRLADAFRYTFPDIEQCGRIVAELEDCLAKHPSCAAGHAVLAEAILACLMCDAVSVFPLPKALLRAEEAVKTGLTLNDELWRLHVVAGAIHCCRFEWEKADAAYKTALHLSPHDTIAHIWYVAFLVAVGKTTEAEQCLEEAEHTDFRQERPWVRIAPLARSLFCYMNGDFLKSYLSLPFGLVLSRDFLNEFPPPYRWLGEVLIACLNLAQNMSPEIPQQTVLENCTRAETWISQSKVGAFEGLIVLMRMRTAEWVKGQVGHATPALVPMEPELRTESPVSSALAYMATARPDEAITQLEKACETGHPLMFLLHVLPIFDPLRKNQRLKALIKRMNLPQRSVREG